MFFLAVVFGGFLLLRSQGNALDQKQDDDSWKNHPALAEPDGKSHRGDKMVAADIKDQRVLNELGRRYKATKRLRVNPDGISGAEDFEKRQEYLLRLLDHYWFSEQRIVGMTRARKSRQSLVRLATMRSVLTSREVEIRFAFGFMTVASSYAFYAMGY